MNTHFAFGESELAYSVRDNAGAVEFSVDYGEISNSKRTIFRHKVWLRNFALIWIAMGFIQILVALKDSEPVAEAAYSFIVIGLGCLAAYWFMRSTSTVVDTSVGRIFVVRDRYHDAILETLGRNRRNRIISLYRQKNYGGDSQAQLRDIEWLLKSGVLTKEEAEAEIGEITRGQMPTRISERATTSRLH